MSTTSDELLVEAEHGKKMISFKVRFWTDGIVEPGKVRPGHAWDWGYVQMESNSSHGLKSGTVRHFHSMAELPLAVEEMLVEQGVQLHLGNRAGALYVVEESE